MLQRFIDYHYSVMGEEVERGLLSVLKNENALFADATLGEGGHSLRFLSLLPQLRVVGIEVDAQILERAKKRLDSFSERFTWINDWSHSVFRQEPKELFNGILMDLGVSTFHYHFSGRGFSFTKNEPLDMRLNSGIGESARDIVNTFREEDLANLFYELGEERLSRRYARAIVEARRITPIETAKELGNLIWKASPNRYGKTHSATKVFQALRIYVNRELSHLEDLLLSTMNHLKKGGRLAVITFHSLEDRLVKHTFRACDRKEDSSWRLLTKKAIYPSDEEIRKNPPSRSAKLRIIERIST